MKHLLLISFLVSQPVLSAETCPTFQEFKKTLDYLKEENPSTSSLFQKRVISRKVAEGCQNASDRFKQVHALLRGIGVSPKQSYQRAIEFAQGNGIRSDLFIETFTMIFASDWLDLSMNQSLKVSYNLSQEAKLSADQKNSEKIEPTDISESILNDFKTIARFCSKEEHRKTLQLSSSDCLDLATRVASKGGNRAEAWVKIYRFLSDPEEANLTSVDSIHVATQAIEDGIVTPANFEKAFHYALDDTGLKATRSEAVLFALDISRKKSDEETARKILAPKRAPNALKNAR
jgi:hypothetical protein